MKITNGNRAGAFGALDLHNSIEGRERHIHVARVRRNALLALPKNGMNAIEPIQRAATAAGIALVALRKRRVVKIVTTRSLQEIAAGCGKISQLWTSPSQQRLTQHWISLHDQWMLGDIGI